jgi:hypothetical protein
MRTLNTDRKSRAALTLAIIALALSLVALALSGCATTAVQTPGTEQAALSTWDIVWPIMVAAVYMALGPYMPSIPL